MNETEEQSESSQWGGWGGVEATAGSPEWSFTSFLFSLSPALRRRRIWAKTLVTRTLAWAIFEFFPTLGLPRRRNRLLPHEKWHFFWKFLSKCYGQYQTFVTHL